MSWSLGIAVQSYDGKLCFGLTADAHVAPDVARLRDYIRVCFDELCTAKPSKTRTAAGSTGYEARRTRCTAIGDHARTAGGRR